MIIPSPEFHVLATYPVAAPSPADILLPPQGAMPVSIPPVTSNGVRVEVAGPEYSAWYEYGSTDCRQIYGWERIFRTADNSKVRWRNYTGLWDGAGDCTFVFTESDADNVETNTEQYSGWFNFSTFAFVLTSQETGRQMVLPIAETCTWGACSLFGRQANGTSGCAANGPFCCTHPTTFDYVSHCFGDSAVLTDAGCADEDAGQ